MVEVKRDAFVAWGNGCPRVGWARGVDKRCWDACYFVAPLFTFTDLPAKLLESGNKESADKSGLKLTFASFFHSGADFFQFKIVEQVSVKGAFGNNVVKPVGDT